MTETVVIPYRFRGPPDSGNGGYACGLVGTLIGESVEVTLRVPPPLDRPLTVERAEGVVRVTLDGTLVAEARPTTLDLDVPRPPSLAEAEEATRTFPWRDSHPLPSCFVCGPGRAPGDGLRIHPGAVPGRGIAAAPFVADASLVSADGRLRPEIAWAVLDCPSWFGYACQEPFEGMVLLGRLAARVDVLPRLDERCIAIGWSLGREGRKITCGSALYTESGALLAMAKATWIALR